MTTRCRIVLLSAVLIIPLLAAAQPVVQIEPDSTYQTIWGLGGAICFNENSLARLPESDYQQLITYLFDDLRVSLVRIRIRNEIERVNDNGDPNDLNMAGLQALPDTSAMRIIRSGRSRGHTVNIIATPWSPPAWMKTNNLPNGGHLTPGMETELAEWIYAFFTIWRDQYGMPIQAVSIQNEPTYAADYESCLFTPGELNRAIRIVIPYLHDHGFASLKHVAPDDDNMGHSLAFVDSLVAPDVRPLVDGFAFHSYGTPFDNPSAALDGLRQIRQRCAAANLPASLTEYGNLANTGVGTLAEGLWEASHWLLALTEANSETYLSWQLAAAARTVQGSAILTYNSATSLFMVRKKFFCVKQISRFVEPGMRRVKVSGLPGSMIGAAFRDSTHQHGAAVMINPTANPISLQLQWNGCDSMAVWRTTRDEDCAFAGSIISDSGSFAIALPDSSVVTLVPSFAPSSAINVPHREISQGYTLSASPNPFNPTTTIRYDVTTTGLVSLTVFDVLGRRLTTLFTGLVPAGSYSIDWNAADLPSGVYFCRMEAGGGTLMQKMVLLK